MIYICNVLDEQKIINKKKEFHEFIFFESPIWEKIQGDDVNYETAVKFTIN